MQIQEHLEATTGAISQECRKKAAWYGAIFGSSIQLAIEIKDAYAPYWGFSKYDLALGSLGSFWPVAQNYSKDLKAINFKFSYFKHSNIYWELESQRDKTPSKFSWYDDYPNQTYWLSADLDHFSNINFIPDWLKKLVSIDTFLKKNVILSNCN